MANINMPPATQTAIAGGLENLKVQTSGDNVAAIANVSAPVTTPMGSLLSDQVAIPKGAPTERSFTFKVDTSAHASTVNDIFVTIGVNALTCGRCGPSSTNEVQPIIGSVSCNSYERFTNNLCSTPYFFVSMKVVAKRAPGSTSTDGISLPEYVKFSRLNIDGEGQVGRILIAENENLAGFERSNLAHVDLSLVGDQVRFDRDTIWTLENLQGDRMYEITVYTGVRGTTN